MKGCPLDTKAAHLRNNAAARLIRTLRTSSK
jgi:hypothetical protein